MIIISLTYTEILLSYHQKHFLSPKYTKCRLAAGTRWRSLSASTDPLVFAGVTTE